MLWRRSSPHSVRLLVILVLTLVMSCMTAPVRAEVSGRQLQLEVIVNGTPTRLIGAFTRLEDGRLAIERGELKEVGLEARGYKSPGDLIVLDDMQGLSYQYEEAMQRILITAPDDLLVPKEYSGTPPPPAKVPIQRDYGGVLNYTLYAAGSSQLDAFGPVFSGASATLDGRAFTPFGTLSQSGIVRGSPGTAAEILRLDTTLRYSDDESMITYSAGDIVSGGLSWTRPVRLGGLHAQRNFGLRPDIITVPLPAASGSAAVPSTVDVYLNNVKAFSQEVQPGPFRINNLPTVSGSGTAKVVLREASGRETESVLPFFASPHLLAPGLSDFSAELGAPRLSYGTPTDTYVNKIMGSASYRAGVLDWLTAEGHGEFSENFLNAGVGAVLRAGSLGVVNVAASGSRYHGVNGFQAYASVETSLFGLSINASSQRTFGFYDDLASVTSRLQSGLIQVSGTSQDAEDLFTVPALWDSARAPKAFDRISIGMPLFDKSSLSLSFIHLQSATNKVSSLLAASWSKLLPFFNASLYATAYTDLSERNSAGFLVGLSVPLGESMTASTSVSGAGKDLHVSVDAAKTLDAMPGSIGWRVSDREGSTSQRSAAIAHRSRYARSEASVSQDANGIRATAEVDGSIATLGGGLFFANRINDSFAVVETGTPGVEVLHENRAVGVTDSSGRALIPGLLSFQQNRIAINTTHLPVNADVSKTQAVVAPGERSGVRVDFTVQTNIQAALVVFNKVDGTPLPAGARGQLEGGESFVVGYDGQAFIKGLNATNNATIVLPDGQCNASFAFEGRGDEQVFISPVICQ